MLRKKGEVEGGRKGKAQSSDEQRREKGTNGTTLRGPIHIPSGEGNDHTRLGGTSPAKPRMFPRSQGGGVL